MSFSIYPVIYIGIYSVIEEQDSTAHLKNKFYNNIYRYSAASHGSGAVALLTEKKIYEKIYLQEGHLTFFYTNKFYDDDDSNGNARSSRYEIQR